jgi:AcrR family transcriptional regulator
MPKKINKEEKKANILEASIRVFAKKGMTKTKMSDIAEAADIGKGTIYEYFRSKDDIFLASFHFFLENVDSVISQRLYRISDPQEKLLAYSSAWAEIFEGDYLEYATIVLDFWAESIRNNQEAIALNLVKIYDENRKMVKSLLEDCITKDQTSSFDTKIAASILIGSLEGLFIQWILDRSAFDFKEAAKISTKIIIDGLKKGD